MADNLADGGFWLPPEFLTDDDILKDKENFSQYGGANTALGTDFAFPFEFPHNSFGPSPVTGSPVESLMGSTETESDEEDLLLSGLARQLGRTSLQETQRITCNSRNTEKPGKFSGSPQSTLNAVGSWSGIGSLSNDGSPNGPTNPLSSEKDAWFLIHAAAGQMARLNMNVAGPPPARRISGTPHSLNSVHTSSPFKEPNVCFCPIHHYSSLNRSTNCHHMRADQLVKQQGSSIWRKPANEMMFSQQNQFQQPQMFQNRGSTRGGGVCGGFGCNGRCGRSRGLPQSGLPPLQIQHNNNPNHPPNSGGSGLRTGLPASRTGLPASRAGVRKGSTGTGVFIPRRYVNPSEAREKPVAGYSTAPLPTIGVQAFNKTFEDMKALPCAQLNNRARSNGSPSMDYDVLVAQQRNAKLKLLMLQRRGSMNMDNISHEVLHLPTDWTY